jgi:hypothetical protein
MPACDMGSGSLERATGQPFNGALGRVFARMRELLSSGCWAQAWEPSRNALMYAKEYICVCILYHI